MQKKITQKRKRKKRKGGRRVTFFTHKVSFWTDNRRLGEFSKSFFFFLVGVRVPTFPLKILRGPALAQF